MSVSLRLVNEGEPKVCRSEQVARGEAECQRPNVIEDGRLNIPTAASGGEEEGGSPPSFLVLNKDNVNAQLHHAHGLITMWDFLLYKGRIGNTHVILNRIDDPSAIRIMPVSSQSRYFDDGRLNMSRKIRRRLGRYEKVPGLMQTLTYDPKKTGKRKAWASFGKDTRRFINAVNQYRKRRGWQRLHYLWVVEVQKETGYPHVHIFFPNLRWLAPLNIINGNWRQGRANIESPRKIKVNCAAYISKYLRKMQGWSDLHLALLWSGKCRMYGFSRGFSAKIEKLKSEWERWRVVETRNLESLEESLAQGGYVLESSQERR